MSAKIVCFFLLFLAICYDIEGFTAGAGNIGTGRKRELVNKVRTLCRSHYWCDENIEKVFVKNFIETNTRKFIT